MNAQSKLIAWIAGVLLASGALAWVVKDFADAQQRKGADTVILAQTAASNDTIAAALKPLLKQSIDTQPAQTLRTKLYEPVRDSVIAEINAIDSAAGHPAIPSGGSLSPYAAVPDSGAKPLEWPAALSPLPASQVPTPQLDPAQVSRALKGADSTIKACTVPFATCAKENALFRTQLRNDTLRINALSDTQLTGADRVLRGIGIGAIAVTVLGLVALIIHH